LTQFDSGKEGLKSFCTASAPSYGLIGFYFGSGDMKAAHFSAIGRAAPKQLAHSGAMERQSSI
jgi:hypothetical protein